ncbi:cytochrome c family protein [Pseudooceanicola lipolyticus]|uniref:Cytochrome c family protein n=2 Tax=Pseudooceanicola TaxID=1679449 RepID=A0A2M8IXL6_9RHOB|nr:c-type cytochrome [Pseudooceanicola lipolyticus]PJE35283.1 cytochrome c family protein [Pseudooceanicola lipolyticus]
MDTMTSTKVVAGFCAAFLVFLLGKWAAEGIYHVGGHGEQAYVIDTGVVESDGGGEDDVDFAALVAEADPDKGASVFRRCQACHRVEPGENITGPTLYGVVGRAVGGVDGFGYSDAMANHGGTWTIEELSAFLENPRNSVPGTAMSFAGLRSDTDRANVIAYLQSLSN